MKKSIFIFISLFFFLNFLYADKKENIGLLATVNGAPITLVDVLQICGEKEAQLVHMYKGKKLRKAIKKLRKKALERAINRKLVFLDFKRKGYSFPKQFIEKNFSRLLKKFDVSTRDELKEKLKDTDLSYEELKQKAYEQTAVDALLRENCYRNVYITPKETYQYYKKHKNRFVQNKKVKLGILKLKKDGKYQNSFDTLVETLNKALNNATKSHFEETVLMYSEGANTEREEILKWTSVKNMRKRFKKIVNSHDVGDIAGPIKTKNSVYFIRIYKKRPKTITPYKKVKEKIKKRLKSKRYKKNYNDYIDRLREKANLEYYI